jgi:hypothetical protein
MNDTYLSLIVYRSSLIKGGGKDREGVFMKNRKILFGIAALLCAAMVVLTGLAGCTNGTTSVSSKGGNDDGSGDGGGSILTAGTWKEGSFWSSGNVAWYSFKAAAGKTYILQ